MSKHISYRGVPVDMDQLRRANEHVIAVGNAGMNARGDKVSGGKVTKTAEEIARENHRVIPQITQASIKGEFADQEKKAPTSQKATPTKKRNERELDNGDIVEE